MSDYQTEPEIHVEPKYPVETGEQIVPLGQQALDRITNAKEITKQDLADLLAARTFVLKRIEGVDLSIDGTQSTGSYDQGAYAGEESSLTSLKEELNKVDKHLLSIGYNFEKGRLE